MSVHRQCIACVAQLLFLGSMFANPCCGGDGDPVAIRFWEGGVVTLETHWNLVVQLDAHGVADKSDKLNADLRLNLEGTVVKATGEGIPDTEILLVNLDHYLDRAENEAPKRLVSASEATFVSANAVHVSSLGGQFIVVAVDGVHLLGVPKLSAEKLGKAMSEIADQNLPTFDAILELHPDAESEKIAAIVQARKIVRSKPELSSGNTIPVSRSLQESNSVDDDERKTAVVEVGTRPWELPGELRELFEQKEAACRESQAVFAKLSVAQLNFAPANGTHTPRWNAEHMMGRELLFFSQIYGQIEPAIAVVDLNPKQMPPDYKAAHPDWNGEEEARQMQRVSAFSRRYAYLLRDLDLDKKPTGSFWTPRGLLKQMQRHYEEHTANVVKKFELEDWPKE